MKKVIAIMMAAAMMMPMTAYASAVEEEPERPAEEEDLFDGDFFDEDLFGGDFFDEDGMEETIGDILSNLEGIVDDWDDAFPGSGDAKEEDGEKSPEYEAYDEIIEEILDDIRDTVSQLKEDWDALAEEVGGWFDEKEEDAKDDLSDWWEDCLEELEDLMDRTNASSRDFLRLVVPDTDGDDAALEDALNYYYESLLDGTLEILYDEILADAVDEAIGTFNEFLDEWDEEDWDAYDWDDEQWDAWSDYIDWWDQFDEYYDDFDDDEGWRPNIDIQSIFNL